MINAIIRWSLENRLIVLLAALIVSGYGVYAVNNTPVDAIPDLSDTQVIVKVSYPGQSPQVVQDQVTFPLTSALQSVPGARYVRGFSFFGDAYVYLVFDDDVDIYWARSRVLEYLDRAGDDLPAGVKPTLGPDASGVGWVYIYALSDPSGQHDLSQLSTLQDWWLKYELQQVDGVSEVATVGGMVKQYQVLLKPNQLRAFNIPLAHITQAIKRANLSSGGSVIEMAEAEYMVTATGYIQSVEDLLLVPLGVTQSGTPLTIADVATVELVPTMRRGVAELDGTGEVVGGIIVMRDGANAVNTIEGIKAKLDSLHQSLPQGVVITPVYDRSELINNAVDNVYSKLIQELLIVALVCVVFLFHIGASMVAVISLPVGVLVAVAIMHTHGINANIMSLGGIAIAVGAMADGAIVMVDNLHNRLTKEADKPHWRVVAESACEVGPALFFSLLIITVSFLPVFMLEAQEGKLFSPLAFTKTYAMAAAAGLSITLIPVLAGYWLKPSSQPLRGNPVNHWLQTVYRPLLSGALARPKLTVFFALAITLSALYPLQRISTEFMPELDEGSLMYMPTTYAGISVGKARELLQQTDKLIMTVPEVAHVMGKVGRADTATDPAPLTMIESFIQLKPKTQWRAGVTLTDVKAELQQKVQFPGLTNAWVMPIKTRIDMLSTGIKTPLGIKISGNSLAQIEQLGMALEKVLATHPEIRSVYSERVSSGRYITIDIDRLQASRYGLNIADLQVVIQSAVGGQIITNVIQANERYGVSVRYPQSYRDSPHSLANLPIITREGINLALGDVAKISIESGPSAIKSEGGRLTGYIYIDTYSNDFTAIVDSANSLLQQHVTIPTGYSLQWTGQYQSMLRVEKKLQYVVPLTLAIITLLLMLSVKSVMDVLLILVTLPLALSGGIWLLYWLGVSFSVAVGVGVIALAGVAVETGVLMLLYLNQIKSNCPEASTQQSVHTIDEQVITAAVSRVRPVLMTVLTVVLGLVPVVLGTGVGTEVMRPIAIPLVGGMFSALILTLFVIPVIYRWLHFKMDS